MKVLCTFSGHYGDILWSLPTARELAKQHGGPVDFGVMSHFKSIIPLLESQSYIDKAFVVDGWILDNECFGCQPWQSPPFKGREKYEKVIDLTYRSHPHSMRLAEWTARQAGVSLPTPWVPFIDVPEHIARRGNFIAYNFNPMYPERKQPFLQALKDKLPGMPFFETGTIAWQGAALTIDDAVCFLGCRSSNYALAHGVGAKVIVIEPHPARTAPVFDFPFGPTPEVDVSMMTAENAVNFAFDKIKQWTLEKEQRDVEYSAAQAGRSVRPAGDSQAKNRVLPTEESDQAADAIRE